MLLKKFGVCVCTALVLILTSWPVKPSLAQQSWVLHGVYPYRGTAGAEVDLLLSGEGFLEFGRLTNVFLEGQTIPFSDYTAVSNQYSRVRIALPEGTAIRETEISFIFENFGADAFFIVMGREESLDAPIIVELSPREGLPDSELTLFLEGRGFFELGELGGILIGEVDIPVFDIQVESEGSMRIAVYFPGETPVGETQIAIFFENASFAAPFLIRPREPEIVQPSAPTLRRIFPQEGWVDSELLLTLEGESLLNLGSLIAVNIGGLDVPVSSYNIMSDNLLEIVLYLPVDTPPGEQSIAIIFENAGFEDFFFVIEREPGPIEPALPALNNLAPPQAEADTEIEMRLIGENLLDLGGLIRVHLSGSEIPVSHVDVISAEEVIVGIYLPEDTPTGEGRIEFEFENASLEAPFFVFPISQPPPSTPPPPPGLPPIAIIVFLVAATGILGVVAVAAIGIMGVGPWRLLRRPGKPTDQPRGKPGQPAAEIDFIVSVDPGIQSVELAEPSLKMDIDIHFEVTVDKGEQHVEPSGSSIISRE